MATTTIRKRKTRKLSVEERRAINAAKPTGNKYMDAFRRNKGSFIVYDPAYML